MNVIEVNIPITKATYQEWVAGVKGGGSGIQIELQLKQPLDVAIELDSIYFKGYASKLEKTPQNSLVYLAHIKTTLNSGSKPLLVDEPTNKLNEVLVPVTKPGEALLGIIQFGKRQFINIGALEKKETLLFPKTN